MAEAFNRYTDRENREQRPGLWMACNYAAEDLELDWAEAKLDQRHGIPGNHFRLRPVGTTIVLLCLSDVAMSWHRIQRIATDSGATAYGHPIEVRTPSGGVAGNAKGGPVVV